MSLLDSVKKGLGLSQDNASKALFDLVYKLWDEGSQNLAEQYKKQYGYYCGDYKSDNAKLNDQTRTACNIIKRVIEVKTAATMDAQFTAEVVPAINVFADMQRLKDMQDYADVLNSEVQNILAQNDWDSIKEIQLRRGLIGGVAPSQTIWDDSQQVEGCIKLSPIEPQNYRWDKNAKRSQDCTFNAYLIELNPSLVKKQYAKDNQELCDKIDELAESKPDRTSSQPKGVVNASTNSGASQAFVYDTTGITSGKVIRMVVMFILDDSVYQYVEGDNADEEAVKNEGKSKYPNGRMIVFAPDKDKRIIFDDRPAPEAFKSLGNIDVFRPMDMGEMIGKGEVDDLMPIQDRINGVYNRLRVLIGEHISTILLPDELKGIVAEGALVQNAVTFIKNISLLGPERKPTYITNNNIEQAMKLLDLLERYEQEAYRTARINETILSGEQVTGITSAAQVDALQQSPMESIRALQRNFKIYVIAVCEKIIRLIQENYSVQRLLKLSTGIQGNNGETANYARFKNQSTMGADGKPQDQQSIELLDEAGKTVKAIKIDKDWKFTVTVSAGTEIPRSRRELAKLTDEISSSPVMQSGNLDLIELYLTSKDFPKKKALLQILENSQKAASEKKYTIQDIITNPALSKSFSEMVDSLAKAGMTSDITAMLKYLGLTGMVDTLATAPVQAVASRADVLDVVAATPGKVHPDKQTDQQGREIVGAIIDQKEGHINGL